MKRIMLLVVGLVLSLTLTVMGQGAEYDLLLRISNLRGNLGLAPYVWNAQLAQAAANHAQWLAQTGIGSHRQSDGSLAADRARRFGYPGERARENYFMGSDSSIEAAWRFWLGSAPHYNNMTSSLLSEIGIGRSSIGGRTAYVLVFGHNAARGLSQTGGSAASGAAAASAGQPAYILGLDEVGNIRHEVQPGHTMGDIALIYGYTWDDIPAMLELNGMSADDIRYLQPGAEFLVPPKAGTFTPTSVVPVEADTATATHTAVSTDVADTPTVSRATPTPTKAAVRALRIEGAAITSATPAPAVDVQRGDVSRSYAQLLLLGAAILAQLGVIGGAALALLRRSR